MNNENELIDSLLREHASMKKENLENGVDEQFLEDLERKLDEVDAGNVVPMVGPEVSETQSGSTVKKTDSSSRWALGIGVAACAALGFMGYKMWDAQEYSDVVLNSGAAEAQINESLKGQTSSSKSVRGAIKLNEDEAAYVEAETVKTSEVFNEESEVTLAEVGDIEQERNLPKVRKLKPKPIVAGGKTDTTFGRNVEGLDQIESARVPAKKTKELRNRASSMRFTPKKGQSVDKMSQETFESKIGTSYEGRGVSGERYGHIVENAFIAPLNEDTILSTFAVDVDTASYANLRRMIGGGNSVPANAVRIEEMINYFDYAYQTPPVESQHPFTVQVDATVCPWNTENQLVRVAIQGQELERKDRPASNITFLLDVSGSMNNSDKLPLLKESLKYLLEELNEKDRVSIAVYAGASGMVLEPTAVNDAGRVKILQSLDNLSSGGSTAGGAGIKLAYKMAQENFIKDGVNRVILATDGDFNVGVSSTDALTDLVKSKAKDGVYLSVLGFGTGNLNDAMMESITNHGNGNYSYIDSLKEGRKVLLEDMTGTLVTIAKDVKVQLDFNPDKVKEYRLVGYSNRVLPNEAFTDKKADAGEIGAGHTVTAFYEVVPGKAGEKHPLASSQFVKKKVRQEVAKFEVPAELAEQLLLVKLAYKMPDEKTNDESTYLTVPLIDKVTEWDKADTDFKFASSVALFGMILSDSEHSGDGDLSLVEKLAIEGKGNDGKGQREEFLQLVRKELSKE